MLAIAVLVLSFAPVKAAGGLQVEPARFVLQVQPGGRAGGAIQVTDLGTSPVAPIATIYDWDIDAEGRFLSQPAGSRPDSLAGWLRFNPRQFSLVPQGRQVVRFSVSPPRDASPGERRGVIFFEQRASKTGGANLVTQLGVVIYVAVEPVRRTFGVSLDDVRLDPMGQVEVAVTVRATGNAHCRPEGTFELYDNSGKQVCAGRFPQQVALPGREVRLVGKSEAAGLKKSAKYRVHVRVISERVSKAYSRDFFDVILH